MFLGNPVGERDLIIFGGSNVSYLYALFATQKGEFVTILSPYSPQEKLQQELVKQCQKLNIQFYETSPKSIQFKDGGLYIECLNNYKFQTKALLFNNLEDFRLCKLTGIKPNDITITDFISKERLEQKIYIENSSKKEIANIILDRKWKISLMGNLLIKVKNLPSFITQ